MRFSEFIDTIGQQVKIGDRVWICDFYHSDILNKPNRHVRPQEVVVAQGKPTYGITLGFQAIGKNGVPKKQIINGYASSHAEYDDRNGSGVGVFFDERSCREYYQEQCDVVLAQIDHARKREVKRFDIMESETLNDKSTYSVP